MIGCKRLQAKIAGNPGKKNKTIQKSRLAVYWLS
jgi:hypothetical protein